VEFRELHKETSFKAITFINEKEIEGPLCYQMYQQMHKTAQKRVAALNTIKA
jgi:hypothetical protein